jgi:hypothetical protein
MQTYQLLNCDDHANYLLKHKKDPALYRPDITHQVRQSTVPGRQQQQRQEQQQQEQQPLSWRFEPLLT